MIPFLKASFAANPPYKGNSQRFRRAFCSVAAAITAAILLGGCTLPGRPASSQPGDYSSDTSTLQRRRAFLAEELKEPRALKADEITVTVRIRPQFVLHLNQNLKVTDFEALNDDAVALRGKVYKKWYRKPFQKAIRHILEQCVIDGYISDNNPNIAMFIEEGGANLSRNKGGRISLIDIPSLEEKIKDVAENVVQMHGISAEVVVSTAQEEAAE